MSLETKIYSNHSLKIPKDPEEIINIFREIWRDQIEIVDSVEVLKEDLKIDSVSYKILINPKLITFQYPKFNQITLNTNYRFSGHITLYPQTVRFTPVGIGKNATNMITNFMDETMDFHYNPKDLKQASRNWRSFKKFLYNFTAAIGGSKFIFLNDGIFCGIEEIAWDGGTVDEMINRSKYIVEPCYSKQQFIDKHTWVRPDGIRNVKGNIWFDEKRG